MTLPEIALKLSLGIRTVKSEIKILQDEGILTREEGKWIIQKQAINGQKQAIKASDKVNV